MKTRLRFFQTALVHVTILICCLYSQIAFAADDNNNGVNDIIQNLNVGDITSIITNIANNSIPGLTKFMTSFCIIMGFWFIYRSIYELRKYGELRTMMRVDTNLMKPLSLFFAGIVLLFWPTTIPTVMQTVFATDSPLSYQEAGITSYQSIIKPIGMIVQFIGFVAFVRGIALLTTIAEQGAASQGALGKAMAHIIGGILAFNIYGTWQVLANTMFTVLPTGS